MTDFTNEIQRLQKLSCILLSPEEEQKFWAQLTDIIGFLWKIPQTEGKSWTREGKDKLSLRTIKETKENPDTKKILKNVHHPMINNSIVIKSVLD